MRTLLEVKTEIAEILSMAEHEADSKIRSRYRKRLAYLAIIKNYLTDIPSVDYVRYELKKLNHLLSVVTNRWLEWLAEQQAEIPKITLSEAKKKFDKEYDIPKMKLQIRALKYILK